MKTLDNLNSSKAKPAVKPHLFSRSSYATSLDAILLFGVSLILPACGQTPTKVTEAYMPAPTTTETPEPTATSVPADTPTPTATDTPEPTATSTQRPTPTATLVPFINPIRPVDGSVPIYHCYGVSIGIDPSHNGYDYGFNNYNSINFPIVSIADGVLLYASLDGSDGAIFIDHGIIQLNDGNTLRIISSYWHIIPLENLLGGPSGNQGMDIAQGDSIAIFCSNCGTYPELELQIIGLDPIETKNLVGGALRSYMLQKYGSTTPGEYTHIDPALIGLECK